MIQPRTVGRTVIRVSTADLRLMPPASAEPVTNVYELMDPVLELRPPFLKRKLGTNFVGTTRPVAVGAACDDDDSDDDDTSTQFVPLGRPRNQPVLSQLDGHGSDSNDSDDDDQRPLGHANGTMAVDTVATTWACPRHGCGATFPSALQLERHVSGLKCTGTGPAVPDCPEGQARLCEWAGCGSNFATRQGFEQHVQEHVTPVDYTFGCQWRECPAANRSVSHMRQLRAHMRIHVLTARIVPADSTQDSPPADKRPASPTDPLSAPTPKKLCVEDAAPATPTTPAPTPAPAQPKPPLPATVKAKVGRSVCCARGGV